MKIEKKKPYKAENVEYQKKMIITKKKINK